MPTHRRPFLAALASGTTAALAGCTAVGSLGWDDEPCSGSSCDVGMTRNAFAPETDEVAVGERVVWKNTSGAAHTVTAYDDAVPDDAAYFATGDYPDEERARDAWANREGGIDPGETFSHTFEVPGTYGYVCLPHESGGMTGTIVVTE